ncbi:hypothetical protein [Catellatospora chokoriensis]|uniref:Uncharacterized protein n=1 Tax=Catellatospora chokoriensis TaxID=310353 RepID=A0A8J3JYK5_9ACTN|nr:hypothetical protein [Catellatospora chokoriensis]GIF90839.1 hypothetical protein Cch02nite_42830 [Catellatospora chokoriensis]
MTLDIAVLASAAATTLVTAMAQEGWEGVKSAVARLWRRDSAEQVTRVEAALEQSRQELVAGSEPVESAQAELVAEWQSKLRGLLAAHPGLADELAEVFKLDRQLISEVRFGNVSHHGFGDINQAGRDITVNRSPRRLDD